MQFVLHRNRTVPTLTGHVIEFKKGEPVYVPPEAYDEVIGIGAIPEEELPDDASTAGKNEPADLVERKAAVYEAFEAIILRNNREDFAASGSPAPKVLNDALGWALGSKERNQLWSQFKADKGETA